MIMKMASLQSMSCMTLLFLSMLGLTSRTEAAPLYLDSVCSNTTTFTPQDEFFLDPDSFPSNLNELLYANLANRGTSFYNATARRDSSEKAYGLYLCRGDLARDVCEDCVTFALAGALRYCPVRKVVVIWYDECMLRYSNESFFSTVAKSPFVSDWSWAENVKDPTRFNQVLATSMDKVATDAAYDRHKFATNEASFNGSSSVYSLGQCTQDLSAADCHSCLQQAIARLSICCSGSKGAQVLYPSCNVWYDDFHFWGKLHRSTGVFTSGGSSLPFACLSCKA